MDIFAIALLSCSLILFIAYIALNIVLRFRQQLEEKSKLLSDVLSYKHMLEAELLDERRKNRALENEVKLRNTTSSKLVRLAS